MKMYGGVSLVSEHIHTLNSFTPGERTPIPVRGGYVTGWTYS
jgi:hypothetical protein